MFLDGPAGRLEPCSIWAPTSLLIRGRNGFAIPTRFLGGTLHNKVVFHSMKALNSLPAFPYFVSISGDRDEAVASTRMA